MFVLSWNLHSHTNPSEKFQGFNHLATYGLVRMLHWKFIYCVLYVGLQSASASLSVLIDQDQQALQSWVNKLYNDTHNDALRLRWVGNSSSASGLCGWKGVQCGTWGGESRVVALNLTNLNLTGPMPPGLGRLTGLASMVVANNLFNGSIPLDIGNCSNLQVSCQHDTLLQFYFTL